MTALVSVLFTPFLRRLPHMEELIQWSPDDSINLIPQHAFPLQYPFFFCRIQPPAIVAVPPPVPLLFLIPPPPPPRPRVFLKNLFFL